MLTAVPVALALALAAAPSSQRTLDAFDYLDTSVLGAVWHASEGTPPMTVAPARPGDGGPRTLLAAPFATQSGLRRAVADRAMTFDLTEPGSFVLEVEVDAPTAVRGWTLYFHSGDGWFVAEGRRLLATGLDAGAATATVGDAAAQPTRFAAKSVRQRWGFSKSSFRREGEPAGWDEIDGVRLSAWRGEARDAQIALRRLTAVTHPIAIVLPPSAEEGDDQADAGERRAAADAAALMADMLHHLDIPFDELSPSLVAAGGLKNRRVAILAYNPELSEPCEARLMRFLDRGGKIIACYRVPARVSAALGCLNPRYVRPEPSAALGEMRFAVDEAARFPGMPAAVRQHSWNLMAVDVGRDAKVVGRWFDVNGKPTEYPALVVGPRGAYFSHLVLSDDHAGKLQMLAALLGHLDPALWPAMAETALSRAADVGSLGDDAALEAYCTAVDDAATRATVAADLKRGRALLAEARQLCRGAEERPAPPEAAAAAAADGAALPAKEPAERDAARFADAVTKARAAHAALAAAFLAATPSERVEARAVWNHSGTGAYPGDWERSARELSEAGFNMVLPNMLWGGVAHYPSKYLPGSPTLRRYGDQMEQCCAAAARHGLEVHVWKVNFNLTNAPQAFIDEMRAAGRTQRSVSGEEFDWLCPSNEENRRLECESMLEVARNYPIAGLHFDYIRYPGDITCFCDGCRARFEAEAGPVAHWPEDCYRGPRRVEYTAWRCRQITALVRMVREETRKLRPALKLSAAVFPSYPECRQSEAQDWPAWLQAGYLDFVCPMDYTSDNDEFSALVRKQHRLADGHARLYPGIGLHTSFSALSPDGVVGQIMLARQNGARGFTIFDYNADTAAALQTALAAGAGRLKATPPHAGATVENASPREASPRDAPAAATPEDDESAAPPADAEDAVSRAAEAVSNE